GNLTSAGQLTVGGVIGSHQVEYVVYGTFCANDTSSFQLQVNGQPTGVNPTSLHLCNSSGSSVDLNQYTTGVNQILQPYWLETSAVLTNQFDAATGYLDLSLLPSG